MVNWLWFGGSFVKVIYWWVSCGLVKAVLWWLGGGLMTVEYSFK